MAWTPAAFRAVYKEFVPIADAVIQERLDAAAREVDPRRYGAETDHAVGLRAAHKLATAPFGQSARLTSDAGGSVYQVEFERLGKAKCGGPWLVGQ